ncbi:hypothetical protein QTP88_006755 [Uroleucon formosanum]
MLNDSSHNMPLFSGDSYIRVFVATPPEDSPPDFFYSPFALVRSITPRPITPRTITPRPITPAFDFSQCGQRIVFSQWSPPALRNTSFRYSEMTQSEDSGLNGMEFSPSPLRQSQMDELLRSLSPISPSILNIVQPRVLPEYDSLIFGKLLNTTDWTEDDNILINQMLALEGEWYKDGADEILNLHMDAFESFEGDF